MWRSCYILICLHNKYVLCTNIAGGYTCPSSHNKYAIYPWNLTSLWQSQEFLNGLDAPLPFGLFWPKSDEQTSQVWTALGGSSWILLHRIVHQDAMILPFIQCTSYKSSSSITASSSLWTWKPTQITQYSTSMDALNSRKAYPGQDESFTIRIYYSVLPSVNSIWWFQFGWKNMSQNRNLPKIEDKLG